MFHREPRFVGGDGAYSVHLGGERVLWLFGDTFVARDPAHPHEAAAFLRNSAALQTGLDPRTAFFRLYWRTSADTGPASFFPEPDATTWLWPAHGAVVDGALLLFFERLVQDGPPGPWSFAGHGWDARLVRDPSGSPDTWTVQPASLPASADAGRVIGEAVVLDGPHLYAFGTAGGDHAVTLSRFARAAAAAGDLTTPEHHCGHGRFAADCAPATLFSPGAPEFSVHRHAESGRWIWIASGDFGAAPIVWRTAPEPSGPWTDPVVVLRPPEAARDGAFVYAAKAHPELAADGELAVTYVPSSFGDLPPELEGVYYFPFFARLRLSP